MKSLESSQLVSIFQAIKEINKLFFKFLWNDKRDTIKRTAMIIVYPEGGLKMIDITSFNKSLKAT